MVLGRHKSHYFKCRQLIPFYCPNNKNLKHHSQCLLGRDSNSCLGYLCRNFLNTKINCLRIWQEILHVRHSIIEKVVYELSIETFLCVEMYRLRSLKIQETPKITAVASAALLKSKADLLISQCQTFVNRIQSILQFLLTGTFFLK